MMVGQGIIPCRIIDKVGDGGMGIVCKVHDTKLIGDATEKSFLSVNR